MVETALRGHGLLFYLTDNAPKLKEDGSNATAVKDWGINDGKVMAAMVNSTKQSLIMSLSKFKTAVIPCYIPLGSPSTSAP
jgi:hypothetical protein